MRGGAAPMGQWSFRLDTDAQNLSPLLRFQTLSFRFAPAKMSKALSPPHRGEIGLAPSTPPATRQLPGVRWPFVVPPARRIRLRRTGRSPPAPSTGSGGGDRAGIGLAANRPRWHIAGLP